jgi:hypothetical protein
LSFQLPAPKIPILSKLVWFQKSDATSERQWHDVLGVLRVQAGRLDRAYMDRWAEELGVDGLLAKAIAC